MNDDEKGFFALFAFTPIVGFGVTWLAALAGEPRSAWLICEVMELCK